LFACKLAEWEYLTRKKTISPILILDDVFEKLDETRMQKLLQLVCSQSKSQVFISDTHPERLQNTLQQLTNNFQLIQL
jgi:DNA replication and repair protein RecF